MILPLSVQPAFVAVHHCLILMSVCARACSHRGQRSMSVSLSSVALFIFSAPITSAFDTRLLTSLPLKSMLLLQVKWSPSWHSEAELVR